MACLSPSPSGRRLSELLEEKQEPFVLDLHLLEKGCSSSRLLDGYDTALCWPAAGNDAAAAVLKRLTSKKNKTTKATSRSGKPAAGGLLHLLLSKILRGRSAPAPPRKPAALQFSDSFKLPAAGNITTNPAAVAPAPPPCAAVKTAAGEEKEDSAAADCCYSDGEYSDDEEKQQLSPVSVLEHPFESSPVHNHYSKVSPSKNAMDVFRELLVLDAAYSPALLTHLLAKTDDLLNAAGDEEDDDYYYGGSYRSSSPKNCRYGESAAAAYWDTHRAELARVAELVAAEVPASRVTAGDMRPERRDVGAEVEAAVFEALLMELVVDLGSGCC